MKNVIEKSTDMSSTKQYLIVAINLGDFGSTGNIMINSLQYACKHGDFDAIAYVPTATPNSNNGIKMVAYRRKLSFIKRGYLKIKRNLFRSEQLDGNGYKGYTKYVLKHIRIISKQYEKTIVHLHNVHMANLNVRFLYKKLKSSQFKVLYTMHDSWPYTGGCYCYNHIGCEKWKIDCSNCPQHIKYSSKTLKKRTNILSSMNNLTLIPCSHWLENEIKQSKIKNLPSIVNHGETSLEPFVGESTIKEELGIIGKKVLISVSAYWNEWKGIKYYYQLADILPDNYVLVLVGGILPNYPYKNILHIKHIKDQNKLAEFLSVADVFVSLTQADNLPLVLMEAQICGLPIVGFGHGGTPEEITKKSGIMVGKDNDINKILSALIYVVEKKPFKKEDIIESGNRFKKYESAKRQLEIYKRAIVHD